MKNEFFYSAKRSAFYPESLRSDYEASPEGWPQDAIAITDEDYQTLLKGQASGKVITADSQGNPILSDPVIDWRARAEAQRQSLLTAANSATADWRTELQLDVISEEDKASLVKWIAYIKALKVLDFSSVRGEDGYKKITWPDMTRS